MKIDDGIYPVVRDLGYTTYTKKILDFPINDKIPDNIVYSVGVGNYACNSANVIINLSHTSNPRNFVFKLYDNNYSQNLLLGASTVDNWSQHDNNRLFETRMGYGVEEFPTLSSGKNLYDLELIRGFKYYSEMLCIYVVYQTSDNPVIVSTCDLKTYLTKFSDKRILTVYAKIWAGSSATRSLSSVYNTHYDNRNSILFTTKATEAEMSSTEEIINYTVETFRRNANTTSPSLESGYVLFGLVGFDTYYANISQIENKRAGTIFYNSNFKGCNWKNMINISNSSKPCFIPTYSLSETDIYHMCATLGLMFTPSETIAKTLDLTDENNIINDDLYFPLQDFNKMWAGAYVHGEQNRNAPQVRDEWNKDKNAPFDKGSPAVDDEKYGDDKSTGLYSRTGALTNRYFLNINEMKKLSNYLNNTDTDLLDAILKNIGMAGDNPINSIVSVMYSPLDIAIPYPATVIVGSNLIDTYENPTAHTALTATGVPYDNTTEDLGSAEIKPKYKNYLDYAPYTKYIAYIPFCNFVELDAGIILNKTVSFHMNFDLICGSCECEIRVNGHLYKTVSGIFATECCVQGNDNSAYVNSMMAGTAKTVAGVGGIVTAIATKNPLVALGGVASTASGAYDLATTSREFTATGKSVGLLTQLLPLHVCIYRYSVTDLGGDKFVETVGAACNFNSKIGDLKGLVICNSPDLNSITATPTEISEIRNHLINGIYV